VEKYRAEQTERVLAAPDPRESERANG